MERNLTKGSILKNIAIFSLPYLFSYFLQTLYGMADLYITGQYYETAQITAVSVGSQIMHMVTVIIVGLAMGTTINIGQAVGAQKSKEASGYIGNTITLFAIVAAAMTLLLLLFTGNIVELVSTPTEAVDGTKQYLMICFAGIPFITAYNVISAMFRGLGDSKSPMYIVAAACVLNIALDYLFLGALGLGPAGAALGTTLAQAFSVLLAVVVMLKRKVGISVHKADLRLNATRVRAILTVGVPVALQDGFIQVAFMIITIIANRRGLVDSAAVGIVEKMICFIFLVPSTMLSTVSAISAQNVGAGQKERAAKTLWTAVAITVVYGLIVAGVVQFTAEKLVGLFDDDPAVIAAGGRYFKSYIWDCTFAGVHFSFSGFFCAYGKSWISFVHNVLSIVLVRVPGAYLASAKFPDDLFPMGLAAGMGSFLSVIVCIIAFVLIKRHEGAKS